MGPRTFAVLLATFLIGGCSKRQTGPRVMYVPAPPPAASPATGAPGQASNAASGSQGAWVIEEPAPPPAPAVETEEAPPPAPAPPPVVRRPRRTRPETQEADEAPTVDPNQPVNAGEAPQLEPRSSPATRDELRARHGTLEQRIRTIEGNHPNFTAVDKRTLEDAKGFLLQSERALEAGDMLRAEQLAQKATLLLTALEQR